MITGFVERIREVTGGAPALSDVVPGRFGRFSTSEKRGDENGWFRLFDDQEGGAFGCWRQDISEVWQARQSQSAEDRTAFAEKVKRAREEAARVEAERRAECQAWSSATWEKAKPANDEHLYLQRKEVKPYGARGFKGSLIVPVQDVSGNIHGLQFIAPDGTKRFKTGTDKAGHYAKIGKSKGKTVIVCEGWATGASIHEATGHAVVVAFDAGNLFPVARNIRARCQDFTIIIAADDDHATEGNPGLTKATEAARNVGGLLAVPLFPGPQGPKDTDFNDLARLAGSEAVKACIESATTPTHVEPTPPEPITGCKKHVPFSMADLLRKKFKPIQWAIPGLLPEGLAILSGPPKIGKSWLVMDLCIAVAHGGYALGHFKTEPGSALLLSLEDNERRLQSRLGKRIISLHGCDLTHFHALTEWKRLDQGGLEDLDEWLCEHPGCKIVVIDTIQKIKPKPMGRNGNAYENDYESFGKLQRLALERQCCILLIHHNRKSDSKNDGDPLEAISGSTGITGTMDTILMLRRPRGNTGAVLTATGRDIPETEYGMYFDTESNAWKVAGPAEEMKLQEDRNPHQILDLMKKNAGQMLSPLQVSELLDGEMDPKTVSTTLYRLAKKRLLQKERGKFVYIEPVLTALIVNSPNYQINTINTGKESEGGIIPVFSEEDFDFSEAIG